MPVGGAPTAGATNGSSGGSVTTGGATTGSSGSGTSSGGPNSNRGGTDSLGSAGNGASPSGGRSNGGAGRTGGGMVSAGGSTAGSAGSAGGAGTTPSAGCGVATSLKSGRATLSVSGATREYILRLPDTYDVKLAHKLIFAFHARGGNATQVAGSSNNDYYGLFSRAAGSTVFVSPEGLDAGWRNTDGADITFVKAMLSEFNSKLCIDQQRIFSVGFSFGGMMSDATGCAMADVFRAIAPMSGAIPNSEHPYSGCDQVNTHPIAVWMAHGDNDTVVPLADGKAALELFVARNKCQAQTAAVSPSPCVAYQGCTAGYPIHFCQFSGGHGVPSFASAAIWSFFDQF